MFPPQGAKYSSKKEEKTSKEENPLGPNQDLYVHGNSQAAKEQKHANKRRKAKAKKAVKKPGRVANHHMDVFLLKITREEEAKAEGIRGVLLRP